MCSQIPSCSLHASHGGRRKARGERNWSLNAIGRCWGLPNTPNTFAKHIRLGSKIAKSRGEILKSPILLCLQSVFIDRLEQP